MADQVQVIPKTAKFKPRLRSHQNFGQSVENLSLFFFGELEATNQLNRKEECNHLSSATLVEIN